MKKAISILLTLALLCALAPSALAADTPDVGALPIRWLEYDYVAPYGPAELGVLEYGVGGKLGLCRTDGTLLTEAQFDELWWAPVNGYAPVRVGGKWGKLDIATGKLAVPCVYETGQETFDPVDAQIVGSAGGPYAVATLDGKLLSEYKYWDFSPFSYGLAAVFTADGWGYVDATGAEVIPCRYYCGGVEDFGSDGHAWVNSPEGYNIIDRSGREVFETPKGKLLSERPWRAGHGLWGFFGENGLVGFVDAESGKVVIEPQYCVQSDPKGHQSGGLFNESGYALLWDKDRNMLAVSTDGQRADAALAAPDATSLTHSGGLHSWYDLESGKWGFRDESDAEVVPCVFDGVYSVGFYDGVALVMKDGVYGLLSDPRKPFFFDVAADAWYAPYVDYVAENGVMIGTGDGLFAPERELTAMECLTLALRLYDLVRGGDGKLAHAPEDWGRITLTLSDSTVYSGFGAERTEDAASGLWQFYSERRMFGLAPLHRALRCELTEAEKEHIDALTDKTATVELDGKRYTGTVHRWFPTSRWVMDFEPDETQDAETFYAALRVAIQSGVDPSRWFRDAVYTLYAAIPEADRGGFAAVSDWQYGADRPARRESFAQALAAAAGTLDAVNDVSAVPDSGDAAVLELYRAGILNGVDAAGHFAPDKTLTRAEAAAMVARVLDPALRIKKAAA